MMDDNEAQLRQLAAAMDCITESEFKLLGGYADSTPENLRKRGKGPDYIVFGRSILYPKGPLKEYLHGLTRERSRRSSGGSL